MTWADGALRVLEKSQAYEYAPLPEVAQKLIRRWQAELNPATPEFPVFLTEHGPSKYNVVRSQVPDVDVDDVDIDTMIREDEVVLPAISTDGTWSLMKWL